MSWAEKINGPSCTESTFLVDRSPSKRAHQPKQHRRWRPGADYYGVCRRRMVLRGAFWRSAEWLFPSFPRKLEPRPLTAAAAAFSDRMNKWMLIFHQIIIFISDSNSCIDIFYVILYYCDVVTWDSVKYFQGNCTSFSLFLMRVTRSNPDTEIATSGIGKVLGLFF